MSTILSRGRRPKSRLTRTLDKTVRRLFDRARRASGSPYATVDKDLRKSARWTQNVLKRYGTLTTDAAQELLAWVRTYQHLLNAQDRDDVRHATVMLTKIARGLSPVPILILERDVDRVSDAFDDYLRKRGRGSIAKGFLGAFLRRPSSEPMTPGVGSYARSCTWAFATELTDRMALEIKSQTIRDETGELTFTPAQLRALLLALEYLETPKTLPKSTKRELRKLARRQNAK